MKQSSPPKKAKIAVVLGTRPEATKLAPVILELRRFPRQFKVQVISTGQHREMLAQSLAIFGLKPDVNLDIMLPRQSLEHITSAALNGLGPLLSSAPPDLVLAEGDTTTVFAAALAAFYHKIPVAHLEAGLRTSDCYNPFPEEINRRLVSVIASLHLAPTPAARDNLLKEGHSRNSIYVTGNTAVDAVLWVAAKPAPPLPAIVEEAEQVVLVTAHRRENWGEPFKRICSAILEISRSFPKAAIIFCLHPNPAIQEIAKKVLSKQSRIHLLEHPEYLTFVHLMKRASLILTDSGGIQEEAPSLDKPVLVLRDNTERPEGLKADTSLLVGTDPKKIVAEVGRLLTDKPDYQAMAGAANPFGDGLAAKRAREALQHYLGMTSRRPKEFKPAIVKRQVKKGAKRR
jgi:UDP-N-acetylglucosamine 2-epimerase (non-hydrolysing)